MSIIISNVEELDSYVEEHDPNIEEFNSKFDPPFAKWNSEVANTVLHVGCGVRNPAKLHKQFQSSDWCEVRLDINADVKPDIIASMTDMSNVESEQFDAIWSSHNLEHLESTDVPVALGEFVRVLKPGGFVLVTLPDLQRVAELVAQDKLDEPAYVSPAGPIAPLDMIFGHRPSIASGNKFMAHRTGFTAKTLRCALEREGFELVIVQRKRFDLWGVGYKPVNPKLDSDQNILCE